MRPNVAAKSATQIEAMRAASRSDGDCTWQGEALSPVIRRRRAQSTWTWIPQDILEARTAARLSHDACKRLTTGSLCATPGKCRSGSGVRYSLPFASMETAVVTFCLGNVNAGVQRRAGPCKRALGPGCRPADGRCSSEPTNQRAIACPPPADHRIPRTGAVPGVRPSPWLALGGVEPSARAAAWLRLRQLSLLSMFVMCR